MKEYIVKRIWWLFIGIIILSACTFSGLDGIRDAIPFLARTPTPTATLPPTPSPTPTPLPSPTPVPHLFDVGQGVFLRPELTEAVFGPFKQGRTFHYMQVSELRCGDYDTYQQSETWVYHGQQGVIESLLTCGDSNYYELTLATWTYSGVEHIWVREDQLAGDQPVLDYPFVLSFPGDTEEEIGFSPYTAYIPPEIVVGKDQAGSTVIYGQPVQILLKEVVEVDQNKSKFYRYLLTGFSIRNAGPETLEFHSKDLIQARANAIRVISNPTVKLTQTEPAEVIVPAGETVDFDLVWKFTRTRYSDHDLAIYISFNTPLEDKLYVYVAEDSLFFREVLFWQD
jgi:hypothetical protein